MSPNSAIQKTLVQTIAMIVQSPDLTNAERERLQQAALRTVAEFSVLKEQRQVEPERLMTEDSN